MSKLSDAMIQALREIQETGNSTARNQTLTALVKRGLAFVHSPEGTEEVSGFSLTDDGRKAIGVDNIAPEETVEDTSESVEAPVPFFNRAARREVRRNVARFNRSVMKLHGKRTKRFGANVIIKHAA